MLNIVLYQPEIPANTGNIGRTCVITGARLHLVGPLGFELTDRALQRAGLAYWGSLDVRSYADWESFCSQNPDVLALRGPAISALETPREPRTQVDELSQRVHLLTKSGERTYSASTYRDGDYLVFGRESTGLPLAMLEASPNRCERIPMLGDSDALGPSAQAWQRQHLELHPEIRPRDEAAGTDESVLRSKRHDGASGAIPQATPNKQPMRQDICGNFVSPASVGDDRALQITSLNLSNAVAIVLYEALRQLGFPGM